MKNSVAVVLVGLALALLAAADAQAVIAKTPAASAATTALSRVETSPITTPTVSSVVGKSVAAGTVPGSSLGLLGTVNASSNAALLCSGGFEEPAWCIQDVMAEVGDPPSAQKVGTIAVTSDVEKLTITFSTPGYGMVGTGVRIGVNDDTYFYSGGHTFTTAPFPESDVIEVPLKYEDPNISDGDQSYDYTETICFYFQAGIDFASVLVQGVTAAIPAFADAYLESGGDDSYFDVTIEQAYDSDGNPIGLPENFLEGHEFEAWCVDLDHATETDKRYKMALYSSYGAVPDETVAHPENFDLVNYILDNPDYFADPYTACDVQKAIWALIEGADYACDPFLQARVDLILADAVANGEGFQPSCPGGNVAVVLVPVDEKGKPLGAQSLIGQITAAQVPFPCADIQRLVSYCFSCCVHGTLTVVKELIPSNDPGRFDLLFDGGQIVYNVGDGGHGERVFNIGTHSVGEIAANTETTLDNYDAEILCEELNHNRGTYATNGPGPLNVHVIGDDYWVCTITNTRHTGSLRLLKSLTGGPQGYAGPFKIHYDCGAFGSGDVEVSVGAPATVPGIPTGTSCTISEPALPDLPGWVFGAPTFTPSATVTIAARNTVYEVTTHNSLERYSTVTRTQGFWSTHCAAAKAAWPDSSYTLCGPEVTDPRMIAGFWINIAKKSDGKVKRTDAEQARAQFVQQFLAAKLNNLAFGTALPQAEANYLLVYCNASASASAILGLKTELEAFNNSGDNQPFPAGFAMDNATPKDCKDQAASELRFWDTLP